MVASRTSEKHLLDMISGAERSDSLLTILIQSASDSIFIKNTDRRYALVNQAMGNLLGVEVSEIEGATDLDIFGTDADKVIAPTDETALHGKTTHVTDTFRIRGRTKIFDVTKTPLKNESGEIIGILGIARDATERYFAHKRLEESEKKFRNLVNNSSDLLCTHDMEGNILSVNPSAASLLNETSENITGKNIKQIIHSRYVDRFEGYIATLKEEGKAEGIMRVYVPGLGERFWEYSNNLQPGDEGEEIIYGCARDVTDRRHSESNLQQLNSLYRILADICMDIVESDDYSNILELACKRLVRDGDFDAAWLCRKTDERKMETIASAEFNNISVEEMITWTNPEETDSPAYKAILENRHILSVPRGADPALSLLDDKISVSSYRYGAALPMNVKNNTMGSLNLLTTRAGAFSSDAISILGSIAHNIGVALKIAKAEND